MCSCNSCADEVSEGGKDRGGAARKAGASEAVKPNGRQDERQFARAPLSTWAEPWNTEASAQRLRAAACQSEGNGAEHRVDRRPRNQRQSAGRLSHGRLRGDKQQRRRRSDPPRAAARHRRLSACAHRGRHREGDRPRDRPKHRRGRDSQDRGLGTIDVPVMSPVSIVVIVTEQQRRQRSAHQPPEHAEAKRHHGGGGSRRPRRLRDLRPR